jgi:hypothetical protein
MGGELADVDVERPVVVDHCAGDGGVRAAIGRGGGEDDGLAAGASFADPLKGGGVTGVGVQRRKRRRNCSARASPPVIRSAQVEGSGIATKLLRATLVPE